VSTLVADTGEWGTYAWAMLVLGTPGGRIAGGSDEVMRNIVGERVGLPKEPWQLEEATVLCSSAPRAGVTRDDTDPSSRPPTASETVRIPTLTVCRRSRTIPPPVRGGFVLTSSPRIRRADAARRRLGATAPRAGCADALPHTNPSRCRLA
jgi:hypothetical protein